MRKMKHILGVLLSILLVLSEFPQMTVKASEPQSIQYLDSQGQTQTCSEANPVSEGNWGGAACETWLYADGSTKIEDTRIEVQGTVNLILCDGATLEVRKGITVSTGNTLNIFCQSGKTGRLLAGVYYDGDALRAGCTFNGAGIGGKDREAGGTITIYGGSITANGGEYGAGIGGGFGEAGGTITIYGGSITANGGEYGAGIGGKDREAGGTITIYGGSITANGGGSGAGIGGGKQGAGETIIISGGEVNASGGTYGAGIGGGTFGNGGNVTITGGNVTAAGGEDALAIGAGTDGMNGTLTVAAMSLVFAGIQPFTGMPSRLKIEANTENEIDEADLRQYMRIVNSFSYMEWDESSKEMVEKTLPCSMCNTVEASSASWDNGWYVVLQDTVIENRVICTGNVRLLLCDGVTLVAKKGITVADGKSFKVYGQSEGNGKLLAGVYYDGNALQVDCTSNCAGIGGEFGGAGGTITIYGGTITANGGNGGAGIGGGNNGAGGTINIYGGTITANGGEHGAGIGGGDGGAGGTINIYGGTITANGGEHGAGIGGGNNGAGGTINIYGGTITANGGELGAGIGGGIDGNGGTITIYGGTITANGGVYGAGIGNGYNAAEVSTLSLEAVKVTAGNSVEYATLMTASERVAACANEYVKVEPCVHDSKIGNECKYCGCQLGGGGTGGTVPFIPVHVTRYCTVTFDVDGGSAVSDKTVKKGMPIGMLPVTVREGYTFEGWYDGETRWTEDTIVSQDITLKAHWIENRITLTEDMVTLAFTGQMYSGKKIEPQVTVKKDELILQPDIDYSVTYENNKNIGRARVIITGLGKYTGTVEKTFEITPPKAGSEFTRNNNLYRIVDAEKHTVSFCGTMGRGRIVTGNSIMIGGVSYSVTEIAKKALYKKEGITTLVIGKKVARIGEKALYGCRNLKKLTFKTTLLKAKTVGENAFGRLSNRLYVKVLSQMKKYYGRFFYRKGLDKSVVIND
ncbi:MAG: hypothetical protein E7280_09030 [Lachnospiraceae bacterium]|nr:hypothetical protein [Lachnospiraceae bacterium]